MHSISLILPGLGNSGPEHWQSIWQRELDLHRVEQRDWETPQCSEWVDTLHRNISERDAEKIILIGHSLACCTIVSWAKKFPLKIKGALLVAPSDTESEFYPTGTVGFSPMPINKLPFPSLVVTSEDDPYVTLERARYFANCWGSKLVNIGNAGHINVAAGFGPWPDGRKYLQELGG